MKIKEVFILTLVAGIGLVMGIIFGLLLGRNSKNYYSFAKDSLRSNKIKDINYIKNKETTVSLQNYTRKSQTKSSKKIIVSISQQKLYAIENNKIKYVFVVSTAYTGHKVYGENHPLGLPQNDIHNHIGTFYIQKKEVFHYSVTWHSNMYYPLWYIYKFGVAIHGTDEVEKLGIPASHGCVRLHPDNAKILYLWANVGIPVIIKS